MHGLIGSLIIAIAFTRATTAAQTEISYQGSLKHLGQPVTSSADFTFAVWDAQAGGNQISTTVRVDDVAVADGLFMASIDFGVAPYADAPRWLEIHVRTPHDPTDTQPFSPMDPRQALSRSPYSIQTRGIYVDDAGQVGIGTTSPEHELDIEGLEPTLGIKATNPSVTSFPSLQFTGAPGPSIFQSLGTIAFHDDTGAFRAAISANKSGPSAAQFGFTTAEGAIPQLQIYDGLIRTYDRFELRRSIDLSLFASLSDGGDAEPGSGGMLVLGDEAGLNLAMDDNEIMARDNAAPSTLYLNHDGGDVRFGAAEIPAIFAFGRINIDGTILSVSANVASSVNSGEGVYDIVIPGIDPNAAVVITPGHTFSGRWVASNILSGDVLRVRTGLTSEPFGSNWSFSFIVINP